MQVCIHRGTQQIGGTCIELASGGQRILLDLGRPLDLDEADAQRALPAIPGLRTGGEGLLAILLSHPHQDHVGLVQHTHVSIPVGIGRAAAEILDRAASWLGQPLLRAHPLLHWEDRTPIEIGPFRITPFLVDHSAYDAYALLVEADGQRLLYSGDFRGHGRKAELFQRLRSTPPADTDVLLMEGTVIGRDAAHREFPTESDLETAFVERLRAAQGLSLVWTSSQNVDRIVTVFRAARRTGKRLILDAFTAEMLAATGNPNLPNAEWGANIGVYVPEWMRRKIKRDGAFDVLERFAANRVFVDRLENPANEILLFRPGMMKEIAAKAPLAGAQLLYSNWSGYLEAPATAPVRTWLEAAGIPLYPIHTSGHASVPDLQRFAQAIAPKMLVPIHSFETARFAEFFSNVETKADGEWWTVPTRRKGCEMTPNRKDNAHYLNEMARFATMLSTMKGYDPAGWAAMGRYVRVNGGGLRPVSIAKDNPCGALLYEDRLVGSLPNARNLGEIIRAATHSVRSPDGKELASRKKEHRVQAWIITKALTDPSSLLPLLHLADKFAEVKFVTDELALNGIRADVVLLGRRASGEWLPVFVELKAKRECTRVVEQLENIANNVKEAHCANAFVHYLAASTGVPAHAIALEPLKLMIWPEAASGPARNDVIPDDIRVLEFDALSKDFEVRFKPSPCVSGRTDQVTSCASHRLAPAPDKL